MRAADELAGVIERPHRGGKGTGQAAHAGRHGALRGRLRFRADRADHRRLRRRPRPRRRRLLQGTRHLARRAARHRPARLELCDGPAGAGRLRRLRRRDRARGGRRRPAGRRQRLEDQARRARRALADQAHQGTGYRHLAQQDQRRTHRRVGPRTPWRARPDGPAGGAAAARAAGAARRAAADPSLAAAPRRRRPAADRTALHRAGAGRRGGRDVRLGHRARRRGRRCERPGHRGRREHRGQAASGTRRVPAAHPARARPARDGRGAAQRHQPGADQDRPADGRRRRGALAHRDRRADRARRRPRSRLHSRRQGGGPADRHAARRAGRLRGADQQADGAARGRRMDVPVGQQPGRRDPRRGTRAQAPAARPAAARRADGRGTAGPRADRHRDGRRAVGAACQGTAPAPSPAVSGPGDTGMLYRSRE